MKQENPTNPLIESCNAIEAKLDLIEAKLVEAELIITGELPKKTRAEAYKAFVTEGFAMNQEDRILTFLTNFGRFTRRQIEEALGLRGSSCSARLNSLVKKNLVVEAGMTVCEYSKKRVVIYSALGEATYEQE